MFVSGHKCEPQHVVHQPPATHIPLQGCSCPLQVVPSVLYWVFSMWRYNGLHLRFLSWAFHVFAYDLAYEPDGWPWRPVRHISNSFPSKLFRLDSLWSTSRSWRLPRSHPPIQTVSNVFIHFFSNTYSLPSFLPTFSSCFPIFPFFAS